jgi:hypothetical protein
VQFGNDDVANKVWVTARASVVCLSGVSDEFSCAPPCRFGVRVVVEYPCNDDGQLVACGDSVCASPAYFSCGACRKSRSNLTLAYVADCWHVARSADGYA